MNFENMTNDEIGTWIDASFYKTGKETWLQAQAVRTVYERLKGQEGAFRQWYESRKPKLSQSTAYRYLKVSSLKEDQLQDGEGLTKLYKRIGILKADKPAAPKVESPGPKKKTRKPQPSTPQPPVGLKLADLGNKNFDLPEETIGDMPPEAVDELAAQLGREDDGHALDVVKDVAGKLGLKDNPELLLQFYHALNARLN